MAVWVRILSREGSAARRFVAVGRLARGSLRGSRQVIAVDTNILIYAHREDSASHDEAYEVIRELAEGASHRTRSADV
jgi:hypothetical protein